MQNEEKNTRLQRHLPQRTLPLEVTAEFTLPDYHSEISRLLWITPTVLPPERYVSAGKAELSGKILFHILYVGPDGGLCALVQESGYGFTLPLEEEGEVLILCAPPSADTVIGRVNGPRKLSVRCKLRASVEQLCEASTAPLFKGEGKEPCRLCDAEHTGRILCADTEGFPLAERVEMEEGTRLILSRGNLLLGEVSCEQDAVRCRGELLLTLLFCKEEAGATPYTVARRIPFEQSIPLAGASAACRACADGTVGEIDASVEEGHVDVVAHVLLRALALREEPVLFYRDVFLPGHGVDCSYDTVEFPAPACFESRHFTLSGERALADLGVGEEILPLDSIATVEIREITREGDKSILNADLCCRILYQRGEELSCVDATFPLRLPLERGGEELHVEANVAGVRLTVAHGLLRADAELQLSLRGFSPVRHTLLREASFGDAQPLRDSCPELYYPAPGERLWDVAKRYGVSPDALAEKNGISAEAPGDAASLAGKRFLLI